MSNMTDYYEDNSLAEEKYEEELKIYFVVLLSLLSIVLILAKCLHARPKLAAIIPEAGMVVLFGIFTGFIVDWIVVDKNISGPNGISEKEEIEKDVQDTLLIFSPSAFFIFCMPPIIFYAGYSLQRQIFMRHITPITLYACLGTTLSAITIAIVLQVAVNLNLTGGFRPNFVEILTFGSLISATDPISTLAVFQVKKVNPQLFYLVFGESVLNDGVGLVLFKTAADLVYEADTIDSTGKVILAIVKFLLSFVVVCLGSTIFGCIVGLFAAWLYSKVNMNHTPLHELSLFILITYVPYYCADLIGLSGIITIFFVGIVAKRFAAQNLSEETQQSADTIFHTIAFLTETFVFIELGMSVSGLRKTGNFYLQFILWAIFGCLLGRAVNVYPITFVFNRFLGLPRDILKDDSLNLEEDCPEGEESTKIAEPRRADLDKTDLRIDSKTAHLLWFAGLRGAVAYACSRSFPNRYGNRQPFVVTTMAIVMFTMFAFGCNTELALNILNIDQGVEEDTYMKANKTQQKMLRLSSFEECKIDPLVASKGVQTKTDEIELSTVIA